ncbi:oligopeptide transporter 4-like protein [Syncephalis fuscata]|nr:oligopeptide transporter 4-like protein [Syncephalis fuscata]
MLFKRRQTSRESSLYATSAGASNRNNDDIDEHLYHYADAAYHDDTLESMAVLDEEDSPFEIVRATVSNKDDPTLPTLTFRFWAISLFFTCTLAFINQIVAFRDNVIFISPIVVQLVSFPLGRLLARLPDAKINLGFCCLQLNPGPFNIKEHTLIAACTNSASFVAYAVDIVVVRRVFYNQPLPFVAGLLLILSTQCIGYGLAGVCHRFLIRPAAMIWPANLVSVAVLRALHEDEDIERERQMTELSGTSITDYTSNNNNNSSSQEQQVNRWKLNSRMRFFLIATVIGALYYFLPGYFFPILSSISILSLIAPKSQVMNQIGSGTTGLGVLSFSLDWNNIVAYLGSPLVTPFWASCNLFVGFVVICWIILPAAYYTNVWDIQRFPIVSADVLDHAGNEYDIAAVLNPKTMTLDLDKYAARGNAHFSYFFTLTYGAGFAALSSVVVHTVLYHGREILARLKDARAGHEDVHARLMKQYKEVPSWWYIAVLLINGGVAIYICQAYQLGLPWWGVILAVGLSALFIVPVGIMTAVANQTPGLNILTELIIGYIIPGNPVANMTFKTYGYISMNQGISFLSDLKLGHYMKIPPRHLFLAQVIGTLLAGTINLATMFMMFHVYPSLCSKEMVGWTCESPRVFYAASVIWGVIGPKRLFETPDNGYATLLWAFLIGALMPLPFWLLARRFPRSWWNYVHTPIILSATAMMPPARPAMYNSWIIAAFVFQYIIYRYRHVWWSRYNYVLSAALETGTIIGILIIMGMTTQ